MTLDGCFHSCYAGEIMKLIKTVDGRGCLPGDFKAGDIIGFSGRGLCSAVINLTTYGLPFFGISHVGIIARNPSNLRELLLYESMVNTNMPCTIQKGMVTGTQAHNLNASIESYNGKVWHYPLYRFLNKKECWALTSFLVEHIGSDYDTIGAIRAGGVAFSWLESKFRKQDLSSIFCSEYCAAAHQRIGILGTNHVSKWSPNGLVRVERRWGILRQPVRLK